MIGKEATHTSIWNLISLDDPASEVPAVAGNKAATLAVLRRAGFDVPPGVVVPAASFDNLDDELPEAVRAALRALPELLGPGPWAVRSSGTAEDGKQASFAGQFETFLQVDKDGLAEAVLRCVNSGHANRVEEYAGRRPTGSVAVLIQPMVAADSAGVAFTIDPVSGRHRTVIEAVKGLGERLVSGSTTPERWAVEEDGSMIPPSTPAVLDASSAKAIARLAGKVEKELGSPQDIEWAISGSTLFLLQARPITSRSPDETEPIPIAIDVPPGYWTRDAFHEPVPISQFGWVILSEQVLRVLPKVFAELGVLIDRAEAASIGGWMYNRTVPVGAPPARRGGRSRTNPTPPRWLLKVLFRVHPAIRRRTAAAREAVASDLPMRVIQRWFDEWRPEHQEDIARALALDLDSLSDQELVAQLDHRLEVIAHPAHAMVGMAWWIVVYELDEVCRQLLGWDTARMLTLLEGLSTTSTGPARQLASLAELGRSKPAVAELLTRVDEDTPTRLAQVDAEFDRAFLDYVEANGHRAVRYDVVDPTLAETPHLLLGLVADQLDVGFSPAEVAEETRRRRNQAAEEARSLLASHPAADRERFETALVRAAETYPAWEDRVWWTQSVQTALMRYLGLALGRRLVFRGQLVSADDIFYLNTEDARSALLDAGDHREAVRVAKGHRAWAMAHPGPYSYGEPPSGDPPFDLLPPPARFVNKAILWGLGQFFGNPEARSGGFVTGTPASAGLYTGTVRVVMGEHEFDRIRAGDVVVCQTTSPAWSIVFPKMGALVTNAGGILSHPAIIAREHRIPAVVDTGNATDILKDGQRVTVDGNRGVVELVAGMM